MNLTYMMFTKHLEGLDIDEIIEALISVGVQGADLCVREGYPVSPSNIIDEMPKAARPASTSASSTRCSRNAAAGDATN